MVKSEINVHTMAKSIWTPDDGLGLDWNPVGVLNSDRECQTNALVAR